MSDYLIPTNLLYKKNYKNKKTWPQRNKIPLFNNLYSWSYEKVLGEAKLPNYENFADLNDFYSLFIQKLMKVIDKAAAVKN